MYTENKIYQYWYVFSSFIIIIICILYACYINS